MNDLGKSRFDKKSRWAALQVTTISVLVLLLNVIVVPAARAGDWITTLYSTCLDSGDDGCRDWGATTAVGIDSTLLGYMSTINFPGALPLYSVCHRRGDEVCFDRGINTTDDGDHILLGYISPERFAEGVSLYSDCKRKNSDDVCQDWGASNTAGPLEAVLLGYIAQFSF